MRSLPLFCNLLASTSPHCCIPVCFNVVNVPCIASKRKSLDPPYNLWRPGKMISNNCVEIDQFSYPWSLFSLVNLVNLVNVCERPSTKICLSMGQVTGVHWHCNENQEIIFKICSTHNRRSCPYTRMQANTSWGFCWNPSGYHWKLSRVLVLLSHQIN